MCISPKSWTFMKHWNRWIWIGCIQKISSIKKEWKNTIMNACHNLRLKIINIHSNDMPWNNIQLFWFKISPQIENIGTLYCFLCGSAKSMCLTIINCYLESKETELISSINNSLIVKCLIWILDRFERERSFIFSFVHVSALKISPLNSTQSRWQSKWCGNWINSISIEQSEPSSVSLIITYHLLFA